MRQAIIDLVLASCIIALGLVLLSVGRRVNELRTDLQSKMSSVRRRLFD